MHRIVIGAHALLALALALYCVCWAYLLGRQFDWWSLIKLPAALLGVILALMALDSAIGFGRQAITPLRPIELIVSGSGSTRLLVLPGFNQDGAALEPVLGPRLPNHQLITYRLPRDGIDQAAILAALEAQLSRNPGQPLDAYVESAGALDLAQLLRRNPGLHIRRLVINAGMSSWQTANIGHGLQVSRILPGGPISTMALRLVQRRNVRNSPPLEAGADQQAAKAAQHNTLNITGAQAFGQMRSMAGTPAVKPGEFAGRIGNVQYLHAPVPNGSDAFVHVNQASAGWIAAVGPSTSFVDTTIESWGAGAHAPTPERPSAVVAAIQDVTAA